MNTFNGLLENFRKQTNSFFRFLLVGVVNTFIGLTVIFLLLNVAGSGYWLSTFVGHSMGAVSSFLLNRAVTFNSTVSIKKGTPRFLIVVLSCYVLAFQASDLLSGWTFAAVGDMDMLTRHEMAVLVGTVFYTIMNYLGQKIFVFR
jgi:putative flippase GtrA